MLAAKSRLSSSLLRRTYSQVKSSGSTTSKAAPTKSSPSSINANVSGLSSNCVKPVKEPVGPGASPDGAYKVPEYFCFNRFSYSEAEVEMAKYRCPQPSALKK